MILICLKYKFIAYFIRNKKFLTNRKNIIRFIFYRYDIDIMLRSESFLAYYPCSSWAKQHIEINCVPMNR